jgi:hypothetical protein
MKQENAAVPQFSFAPPEWFKSFSGWPRNLGGAVKETLEFNASCLQDQADYLKKLAEATSPAEALKCQLDFAQQSWARCFGEAWRVFDCLRTNPSSHPAGT